jgi:uncharacterized damage-inducible protein DinB
MNHSEILTIYDYNYWANRRILNAAAKVTPGQLAAARAFPFGSLRGTLVHIMDAEYGWRTLFENVDRSDRWEANELLERDFPTLSSIQARWGDEEAAMRKYLAGLYDDRVTGMIHYLTDEGNKRERVLWHCLFHVVNHGTQHRSEAAAMLTEFGASPGDLDFTNFLNEGK